MWFLWWSLFFGGVGGGRHFSSLSFCLSRVISRGSIKCSHFTRDKHWNQVPVSRIHAREYLVHLYGPHIGDIITFNLLLWWTLLTYVINEEAEELNTLIINIIRTMHMDYFSHHHDPSDLLINDVKTWWCITWYGMGLFFLPHQVACGPSWASADVVLMLEQKPKWTKNEMAEGETSHASN